MTDFKEHKQQIEKLSSANKIREYVLNNLKEECDYISLFVAFAYLSEYDGKEDKNSFRKKAYLAYISNDKSGFSCAWSCIDYLQEKSTVKPDFYIRILKGGSYKIKNYYLENNDLNDIRGASALLTHVEQNVIPKEIEDSFIPECIVYNGGGNIFAILPKDTDDEFPKSLEEKADKLLITAQIAYYLSKPMPVSVILGADYRFKMVEIENCLSDRKNLKLYNTITADDNSIPKDFIIPHGNDEKVYVKFKDVSVYNGEREFCSACGKRYAKFTTGGNLLCQGCLTKRMTGIAAEQGIYISEFTKETGITPKKIRTTADISKDKIAVVYADGNNMGGIIQQFSKITQMMKFSRNVKEVTRKEVYKALDDNHINAFEIVALGGDDVFVIVPAEKSFNFACSFAESYKLYFDKNYGHSSTMSVGIAAAKNTTPIKILLEAAENELKNAKTFERNQDEKDRDGSISFVILDSYETSGEESDKFDKTVFNTMLPYSVKTAKNISVWVKNHSTQNSKSQIRNLLDAFNNAESIEEAKLFYNYINAKNDNKVSLPKIDGFTLDSGFYKSEKGVFYIWNDILDLQSLCKIEKQTVEEK